MRQHFHCHCHFKEQLSKLKAGKLGLLGGFLIVTHLLFHVAECLILPALIMAFHPKEVEAVTELSQKDFTHTTMPNFNTLEDLRLSFEQSLINYPLVP